MFELYSFLLISFTNTRKTEKNMILYKINFKFNNYYICNKNRVKFIYYRNVKFQQK